MMNLSDYVRYDAIGLAQLITDGQVSAQEVQEAARQAISMVNPQLNGLVGDLFDTPLRYAEDGPFAGLPFLLKDLGLHVSGVPTRLGSRLSGDGIVFQHDTDLMTRFRQAGLAALGLTSTPEFGFNASTEPLSNGPTRNPWDTSRSSGGSSGGSAALVAARALPVAHASDGGGSIRIPSAWCGLVGLKPSRGRIPAGPDNDEVLFGLATEFAVSRSVRDAAALLDLVHGPGVGDKYVIVPPTRPYAREVGTDPGQLRIAFTTKAWSGVPVDDEYVQAVQSVAQKLQSLGHIVEEASPSIDWDQFFNANATLWSAFVGFGALGLSNMLNVEPGPDVLEATVLASIEYARSQSVFDICAAQLNCNMTTRSVGAFFNNYDVLVTPTVAGPPPMLGYLDANDASLDLRGWLEKAFTLIPFTPPFNVTGQPAMNLPLVQSKENLPIGIQFIGRYGDEATLFQLASQLEQALPWSDRSPDVSVH